MRRNVNLDADLAKFKRLTDDELKFITGGTTVNAGGGSTSSSSQSCDTSCNCATHCCGLPPIKEVEDNNPNP